MRPIDPGEQDVAHDCQTLLRIEQGDASRRMPRTMQDLECQLPDLDLISVFQPSVRRDVRGVPDTERAGTFGDVLQQKQIVLVGTLDRNLEARLQVCGTTDVIDVAVGQPDLVDRDAGRSDGALDLRRSPPGSMTTARLLVSHHRTVQFCWNGVTGTMMALALVMGVAHQIGMGLSGRTLAAQLAISARDYTPPMRKTTRPRTARRATSRKASANCSIGYTLVVSGFSFPAACQA